MLDKFYQYLCSTSPLSRSCMLTTEMGSPHLSSFLEIDICFSLFLTARLSAVLGDFLIPCSGILSIPSSLIRAAKSSWFLNQHKLLGSNKYFIPLIVNEAFFFSFCSNGSKLVSGERVYGGLLGFLFYFNWFFSLIHNNRIMLT